MSIYGFAAFCLVYLLAVATPGPGVAAVIARSLAQGARGAPWFIAGFLIGDLVWFAAAAGGLAALAQSAQGVFLVIRYAGAGYLLYLAYRLWTAPVGQFEIGRLQPAQTPARSFFGSLALTLGNPKPMIFFLALLPALVHLRTLRLVDYLLVGLAIVIILPAVLGTYVLAASRARRFFRDAGSVRLLNRGAGTAIAGAAVVVATQ
jgi:threonine/homoserine/homoserine lactone efflux protein